MVGHLFLVLLILHCDKHGIHVVLVSPPCLYSSITFRILVWIQENMVTVMVEEEGKEWKLLVRKEYGRKEQDAGSGGKEEEGQRKKLYSARDTRKTGRKK